MEIIQNTFFSKMFPEFSQATTGTTFQPSSQNSSASLSQDLPMCLVLKTGGPRQELYFSPTGRWLGEHTMLNYGEGPSGTAIREMCSLWGHRSVDEECRLSLILEENPHPKYYLSQRSCLGILNRAKRRQKTLPEPLRKALEYQAGISS